MARAAMTQFYGLSLNRQRLRPERARTRERERLGVGPQTH
jgi:hypothetical protein